MIHIEIFKDISTSQLKITRDNMVKSLTKLVNRDDINHLRNMLLTINGVIVLRDVEEGNYDS